MTASRRCRSEPSASCTSVSATAAKQEKLLTGRLREERGGLQRGDKRPRNDKDNETDKQSRRRKQGKERWSDGGAVSLLGEGNATHKLALHPLSTRPVTRLKIKIKIK